LIWNSTPLRISQDQVSHFVCKFRKQFPCMADEVICHCHLQGTHQRLQLHFDYNCSNVALLLFPSAGLGSPLSCIEFPLRQLRGSYIEDFPAWASFYFYFFLSIYFCFCSRVIAFNLCQCWADCFLFASKKKYRGVGGKWGVAGKMGELQTPHRHCDMFTAILRLYVCGCL